MGALHLWCLYMFFRWDHEKRFTPIHNCLFRKKKYPIIICYKSGKSSFWLTWIAYKNMINFLNKIALQNSILKRHFQILFKPNESMSYFENRCLSTEIESVIPVYICDLSNRFFLSLVWRCEGRQRPRLRQHFKNARRMRGGIGAGRGCRWRRVLDPSLRHGRCAARTPAGKRRRYLRTARLALTRPRAWLRRPQ